MVHFGLSFIAGTLTITSPCVLPILPIVVGSTFQRHRHGPLYISLGLISTFTFLGVFVSAFGLSIGIDAAYLRTLSAIFLITFDIILIIPQLGHSLQKKTSLAMTSLTSYMDTLLTLNKPAGLSALGPIGNNLDAIQWPYFRQSY